MFNFGDEYMKQFYDNWQKTFGGQLEKMVNDQEFISQMAKAIAATMTGKSMASKTMNEAMAMMNLPTKDDLVLVQQKLTDIEERLIDHSEDVEDTLGNSRENFKKLNDTLEDYRDIIKGFEVTIEEYQHKVTELESKIEGLEKGTAKKKTKKTVKNRSVKKAAPEKKAAKKSSAMKKKTARKTAAKK